jgi:putative transposase
MIFGKMAPRGSEGAMKKTRFSEEQIVKILREADAAPVMDVAKKHGISDLGFPRFGGRSSVRVPGSILI